MFFNNSRAFTTTFETEWGSGVAVAQGKRAMRGLEHNSFQPPDRPRHTPSAVFFHWRVIVPEPTSSGVAGAAAFKSAGGAAAGGALLSAIVVMLMTPPRLTREWAVGLISTVVTGIGGGAIAVQYFRLQEWVDSMTGLLALGGLIFGCGLPGWAIVRWLCNCGDLEISLCMA
ncbi:hypothetical protein [Accumulibacter sp.]|uniref:hypothetical protein n=1 Tax=Accumulibacter sp. TaxID=2053492 RepID=UPI002637A34B|nr:hypothetical protein [Accumulibacter sp.]